MDQHNQSPTSAAYNGLWQRMTTWLDRFGKNDSDADKPPRSGLLDYGIDWDDSRHEFIVIYSRIDMMLPPVVAGIQAILRDFPDWCVIYSFAPNDVPDDKPSILHILSNEVIVVSWRNSIPEPWRSTRWPGMRPVREGDDYWWLHLDIERGDED
jgi:hypothetical protein